MKYTEGLLSEATYALIGTCEMLLPMRCVWAAAHAFTEQIDNEYTDLIRQALKDLNELGHFNYSE